MSQKAELRRLGFIDNYARVSADTATNAYITVKDAWLPAFVKVRVEQAEGVASKYAAPAYTNLLSTSQKLLVFADDKVDHAVLSGSDIFQSTAKDVRNVAEPDVLKKHFDSAKEAVSNHTSKAIDFVKANGLVGTTQHFVSEAMGTTKKVLEQGSARGRSIASSALNNSQEAANYVFVNAQTFLTTASKKSRAAHDAVVKQPLYKNAYERTHEIVTAAQDTTVYKATIDRIYPIVAPVYNPAYEKIEPYYTSTVDYWKPVSAAA